MILLFLDRHVLLALGLLHGAVLDLEAIVVVVVVGHGAVGGGIIAVDVRAAIACLGYLLGLGTIQVVEKVRDVGTPQYLGIFSPL